MIQPRHFKLLFLILVYQVSFITIAVSQPIWNPNHSIGTLTGVYNFAYNQTPAQLVEIYPAGLPNTGFTYQWYSGLTPTTVTTLIPSATGSSYSPPILNTTSVTMYYQRVTTSGVALTINGNPSFVLYSNIIKIKVVSVNWEDINYIREHDVITTGQTTWTGVDQLAIGSKLQTTTYLDGLGRSIEKVSRQTATPPSGSTTWGDMVQFSQFDALGREPVKYLPYTTTNQSGKFKTTQLTDQPAYYANAATYNETSAFSTITFDNSPLNRVMNVKEPGASWAASAGNAAVYDMNTGAGYDNVQILTTDYTQGDAPVNKGVYPANSLYKLTYTDVNGNQVIEFTNKSGQLILKKVQATATQGTGDGGWICTYSVYDDFGLLRFQIQPEGVKYLDANSWSFAGANGAIVLAEQVFQYNYDDKGRTTWKKAPGASPLNMVYDIRDRVVFMQDGNQAGLSTPQWTANLYDILDRPVFTTLLNTTEPLSAMQTDATNAPAASSISITSSANTGGPTVNVNLSLCPGSINTSSLNSSTSTTVLKYLFYDNYTFSNVSAFNTAYTNLNAYSTSDPNVIPIANSLRTLSMPTGSMVRVLGTSIFLPSTNYFDEKGRHIQTIETNIRSGADITTMQYHFDGRLLSSCNSHTNTTAGYTAFITLNKYIFDILGRVTSIQKTLGSNAAKTIANYDYDDVGRVVTKHLDPNYNNPNSGLPDLESLNYTFNIHNQITGINKDYALKTSGIYTKWGHFFGLYLGFDNKDNVFNHAQLNGQVTGLAWNTQGDDAQRKYDYTYDNAGRLINAAFNQQQHPGDGWSNSTMDFSVSGTSGQITYDNNGNLLTMLQKGVMPGQAAPIIVDDLRYVYNTYSNKLQSVTDQMTATTFNGLFGDFKDGTNAAGTADYVYDANGNVVVDLNKNAQSLNGGAAGTNGIHYNYLDKPDQIRIVGKGTIEIVYSADGEKLQRAFIPETAGTSTITTYINQYIYQETSTTLTLSSTAPFSGTSPHLAYMNFEEGRLRTVTTTSTNNGFDAMSETGNLTLPGTNITGAWDYFIMDYQQNVRMILTEETHSAINQCTMETTGGRPALEDPVFGQTGSANEVEATRFATPTAWTGNGTMQVSRLGNIAGHNLGPNSLQKVMAGDYVSATVSTYYASTETSSNPNIITNLLSSLMTVISGGSATVGTLERGVGSNITSQLNGNAAFTSAVQPHNAPNGTTYETPQAYLTILFFDERFNLIPAADGGVVQVQVRASDAGNPNATALAISQNKAPKNGYAYIYVSNRSDQDVYFDNLKITIATGNIIEENHYYAFGLKIAAISSHKLGDVGEGKLTNPYQYDDKEQLDEDMGLNWYDYGFRNYDPQIGRFIQLDPIANDFALLSPYLYSYNDPIANADFTGLFGEDIIGATAGTAKTLATVTVRAVLPTASKVSVIAKLIKVATTTGIVIDIAKIASDGLNSALVTVNIGNPNSLKITPQQLKQIFPKGNANVINTVSEYLDKYMEDFEIENGLELCHFLGQIGVETGELTMLVESKNKKYSIKTAKSKAFKKHFKGWTDTEISYCTNDVKQFLNYVYADRMENGHEIEGNGFKFRGRGIFQLTGKSMYSKFTKFMQENYGCKDDFIEDPDLIAINPMYVVLSALWHFESDVKNLNLNFTTKSVSQVTQKVNGALTGETQREQDFKRAVNILIIQPIMQALLMRSF
jgi:RHS repeat-associated protein